MTVSRQIPFEEITIDRNLIYAGMGGFGYVPDGEMTERVEAAISHISAFARPAYLYRIAPLEGIEHNALTLEGVRFRTGQVITPFFREADSVAVFAATTGMEFEQWLHEAKNGGDILAQFVADAIGSAFAEAVGETMAADMAAAQSAEGNNTGNSYSPGYCGWDVAGQRELFSLLPPSPCGITLSDSCLMTPIKSISGLIAVGPSVIKHPYGCEICNRRSCFRNRNK